MRASLPVLPLGGIFAFVGRQLGRILTLAFSWATTALFGRVPRDKQLLLSAMAGASLLWPIVLVSVAFPSFATFLLAFVKLPDWADAYVRPAMIVLAILLPLVVGALSARIQAPSPKGLAILPALLRGYPYATGLFLVLVWMLFLAPAAKIGAIARRWQDAHVPISVQPGGYDTVVRDLGEALGRAGLSVHPVPAGWVYAMPGRILAVFAGKRAGALVPENVVRLAGSGFEVTVHPMDLAMRGAKVPLGRARAAITSELAFTAAHQTWTKRAQELEDELAQASGSGADLDALGEKIVHADLEHEEWDILYRVFLQVQVRRNAGGEKTPGAPRQRSLGERVVRLVTTLPRQLRAQRENRSCTARPPQDFRAASRRSARTPLAAEMVPRPPRATRLAVKGLPMLLGAGLAIRERRSAPRLTDDAATLPGGPEGSLIAYVCVGAEHVRIGRGRPNGTGHLTVHKSAWACCSAAIPNSEHDWAPTGGVPLDRIRHDDISAATEG